MMGRVQIATVNDTQSTAVSNIFIDEFLSEANDAEIKVYLHLLRMMQSGKATNVPAIADKFNHTEKDVTRALEYWQHKGLLRLEYDESGNLTNIFLEELLLGAPRPYGRRATDRKFPAKVPERTQTTPSFQNDPGAGDKELQDIMKLAETYFRRMVQPQEAETILYAFTELQFSMDLMDHLLQYCVEHARESTSYARYMEQTAIGWHRDGVTTVQEAKAGGARHDSRVYHVMRALGLDNVPTDTESEYILRWLNTWLFPMDIIEEACRRTVLQTQKNRLRYCDGILKSWHEQHVRTIEDIERLNAIHDSTRELKRAAKPVNIDTHNRFNRFKANDYDFEEIRNRIVSNN